MNATIRRHGTGIKIKPGNVFAVWAPDTTNIRALWRLECDGFGKEYHHEITRVADGLVHVSKYSMMTEDVEYTIPENVLADMIRDGYIEGILER